MSLHHSFLVFFCVENTFKLNKKYHGTEPKFERVLRINLKQSYKMCVIPRMYSPPITFDDSPTKRPWGVYMKEHGSLKSWLRLLIKILENSHTRVRLWRRCISSPSVIRHAITVFVLCSNLVTKLCADTIARWHGFNQALMAGVAVLTRFQSCL